MKISILGLATTAMALLALSACSDSTGGGGGTPAHVTIVSGDAQTDTAGDLLPQPLVIKVTDASGHVVKGQPIRFTALAASGSAGGGTVTSNQGTAQASWTLGSTAGPQRVEAAALDASSGAVIVADTFVATAVPGAPTMIDRVNDQTRNLTPGDTVTDSLTVLVRDKFQNPVPGVTVSWAVTAGGGSVSPATIATSAAGLAKTRWILGPTIGVQTVSATAGALSTTFQAQVSPRVAVRLARVSGDGQHAARGALLPAPLVVRAFDSRDRPVAGASVGFYDPGVGGQVQVATGPDGTASHTPTTDAGTLDVTLYPVTIGSDAVYFAASSDASVTATVPLDLDGVIVDARHGKAAWLENATGKLWLLDRSSGVQTQVAAAANRAWITPAGVVYDAGGTVYAWRNGATITLGDTARVQVAGDYVLVNSAGGASVYNVATGIRTEYAVVLPASAALRADGDVYYVQAASLKRLSAGSATTLVPADSFAFRGTPSVEGLHPAYVRARNTDPFEKNSQMVYWDGTQEQVLQSLNTFHQTLPTPLQDYSNGTLATNGSWLVWKVEQEGHLSPGDPHFQMFSGAGAADGPSRQYLAFYGLSSDGVAGAGYLPCCGPPGYYLSFGGTRQVVVGTQVSGKARRRFIFGTGQAMFLKGETMIQLTY